MLNGFNVFGAHEGFPAFTAIFTPALQHWLFWMLQSSHNAKVSIRYRGHRAFNRFYSTSSLVLDLKCLREVTVSRSASWSWINRSFFCHLGHAEDKNRPIPAEYHLSDILPPLCYTQEPLQSFSISDNPRHAEKLCSARVYLHLYSF